MIILKDNLNEALKYTQKIRNSNSNIRDDIVSDIYKNAEEITNKCVKKDTKKILEQQRLDDIITSKAFGVPLMILILAITLWLTITGANFPSECIAKFLFYIEGKLTLFFKYINCPKWIHGLLILGVYRTLAWVISVMFPPMAIFFPIFTFLEDLGYLPRVCFNMDYIFKKAHAHGKQVLTMCMGLGCNAAGIISCRIIDSPREKLIAILTNNFIPCNGRFPTLIALSSIFVGIHFYNNSLFASLIVTLMIIIGVILTLLTSYVLSKTLLKGFPSSFTLELPPYRKPQIGRILFTSLIDRTIFVLGRAIAVAAPAGVLIYMLTNIYIGNLNIATHIVNFVNPFAKAIGLDGFILIAFILGFPANEIVIPILIMLYLSTGTMMEFENIHQLKALLLNNGWTALTFINTMLFCLLHFPCATTLWTIKKETGSIKWTILSVLIPTITGITICFINTKIFNILT